LTVCAQSEGETSASPFQAALLREQSICIPEQYSSDRAIASFLFLISFFYLFLFRRYTTMDPDEGIILQGAQRILSGEVLYRDFFSFFTPGSYYFLALIFRIFGSSIVVARTTLVLVGAVLSSITYLLSRRVCSRRIALLTAAIVTVATLPYRFLIGTVRFAPVWRCTAPCA